METLLYFMFWGALLFVMMRFGCGSHVTGHGQSEPNADGGKNGTTEKIRWIPPKSDFDPVCGKAVRPEIALSNVYKGHVYYFCSRDCRERFEASPKDFLPDDQPAPTVSVERPLASDNPHV